MSVRSLRIGTGLFLLIIILGCNVFYPNDNRQEAIRDLVITIDLSRREEFFDQLSKFAKANGFSILIDTLSSSDEEFQIYMKREDIIISGVSGELNKYYVGFFDITDRSPAPDSVYDDLVSELEQYVSEVPGTTISIRK